MAKKSNPSFWESRIGTDQHGLVDLEQLVVGAAPTPLRC
jgi:hypothetical protein